MSKDKLELPGLKKDRSVGGVFRISRPVPKFDDEEIVQLGEQKEGEDFKLDQTRLD